MDYDQQIQAALLRQKGANTSFDAPQGQMVGGRFVAPNALQYIAAGLRGVSGARDAEMAGQEVKDLQGQRQKAIADALRTFGEKANPSQAGTGATGMVNDALPPEMQIGAMPQMAPRKPDLHGAYGALIGSGIPQLQQMGTQGMVQIPQLEAAQREREEGRAFREREAQLSREAREKELQVKIEEGRASRKEKQEFEERMFEREQAGRKELRGLIAASRPAPQAPQVQTMQTENGMLERVNGQWQPVTIGGKPVMPKGAGAGAGNATEGERKAATLLQRMQGSEAQLEAALKLDKSAAKPGLVSSGLRSLGMDTVANTVTPENRQKVEAAQLDILDAALTLGTGAAYTKEQLEGYRKSYFPQLGDKPETVKDKQERLNNVLGAARIAAGRAGGQVSAPAAQAFPDANAIAAEIARRKGGK